MGLAICAAFSLGTLTATLAVCLGARWWKLFFFWLVMWVCVAVTLARLVKEAMAA